MSISRRLLDLARANLTDFRAAFDRDEDRETLRRAESSRVSSSESDPPSEYGDDDGRGVSEDGDPSVGSRAGRKARRFKDVAEETWDRAFEAAKARAGVRDGGVRDPAADRRRWYKTLELEVGAELPEVRRAYRRLMAQYHPDRYAKDAEKLKLATEVTRKLTEAYNGLSEALKR